MVGCQQQGMRTAGCQQQGNVDSWVSTGVGGYDANSWVSTRGGVNGWLGVLKGVHFEVLCKRA